MKDLGVNAILNIKLLRKGNGRVTLVQSHCGKSINPLWV